MKAHDTHDTHDTTGKPAPFKHHHHHQHPGTPPSLAGGAVLTALGIVMTVALVLIALAMAVDELAR